jgi:hypothetical protein
VVPAVSLEVVGRLGSIAVGLLLGDESPLPIELGSVVKGEIATSSSWEVQFDGKWAFVVNQIANWTMFTIISTI